MKESNPMKEKQNNNPESISKSTESLDVPSDVSQEEYVALLHQIQNDFTRTECQEELLDAARYGDIDVVRALLKCYPDIGQYQQSNTGNTALHMAAANGHCDIAYLLLRSNPATVHVTNHVGNTPLHWAAGNGQNDMIKLLLKQTNVDVLCRNQFGRSVLTEGFTSQNEAVVQALLEHDSATEERLLETPTSSSSSSSLQAAAAVGHGNVDEQQQQQQQQQHESVTHHFMFGRNSLHPVTVQIRELAIAKSDHDSILGQQHPNQDTTGLGIWSASLVCAQWMAQELITILQNDPEWQQQTMMVGQSSIRVMELGAGCAVPGLVVANCCFSSSLSSITASFPRPCHVYLTDFNTETVDNIQHNIQLNQTSISNHDDVLVQANVIHWQDPNTWPTEKMNLIIGSDLIYQSDMVPLLVQTLYHLLDVGGIFCYVAPVSIGRQGHDALTQTLLQHSAFELVEERIAPELYKVNPLSNQDDDECFLHFHELQTTEYKLFQYRRR